MNPRLHCFSGLFADYFREIFLLFSIFSLPFSSGLHAEEFSQWNGRRIMEEVYGRHQQFPFVYEEQSMVMVDRKGQRDTRKARRYSRMEEDGTVRFLLLFDTPEEVEGVALLAIRGPDGETEKFVYLPALGRRLIQSRSAGSDGNFLGADFSVESLTGEALSEYVYVRRHDQLLDGAPYFVLDVYSAGTEPGEERPLRRHFIRQDNFYITRTEHYDGQGRLYKLQSHHDLKALEGDMWRASMILMEDKKERHQSLIKIHKRVFSHDYVPARMFTAEWLFDNYSHLKSDGEEIEQPVEQSIQQPAEEKPDRGEAEIPEPPDGAAAGTGEDREP